MKMTIKIMITISLLMIVAFGCKKTTPEVLTPYNNVEIIEEASGYSGQHRSSCTRQQVTTCDSLVMEMNKLKGVSCGIFPCCFPSRCLSSPTYTATVCVDRIGGDCGTTVYTVANQDTLINQTKTAILNYLQSICSSNYSYTVSSFSWQSGNNGCATTHPWLKVTFKYKCCN